MLDSLLQRADDLWYWLWPEARILIAIACIVLPLVIGVALLTYFERREPRPCRTARDR